MDSLFAEYEPKRFEPLAVRLRPTSLDHFYGQEKAVGKDSFLRAMIERDTTSVFVGLRAVRHR